MGLDIEFEFDDVAILHNISLALGAKLTGGPDGLFGTECFEIVKITNAGRDEAAFEVGMNGASGFWGSGAFFDGPGATFFLSGGKERLKTESIVSGFDELFQCVAFYAIACEEFFAFFARHAGHFFLEFGVDKDTI